MIVSASRLSIFTNIHTIEQAGKFKNRVFRIHRSKGSKNVGIVAMVNRKP